MCRSTEEQLKPWALCKNSSDTCLRSAFRAFQSQRGAAHEPRKAAMALCSVVEIALQFESFRNIDLFHQGAWVHVKKASYHYYV